MSDLVVHGVVQGAGLSVVPVLVHVTQVLEVPGRPLHHPLEDHRPQGPDIGAEARPLVTYEHLGRLVRVQEHHVLRHRVLDEEVLEVPETKVGDLGNSAISNDQNIAWLKIPMDNWIPQVVKIAQTLKDEAIESGI